MQEDIYCSDVVLEHFHRFFDSFLDAVRNASDIEAVNLRFEIQIGMVVFESSENIQNAGNHIKCAFCCYGPQILDDLSVFNDLHAQ